MSEPRHFAPRYMTRFACIGGACEDTCCAGWRIDVDEDHYLKLKKAMDGTRGDRERFRAAHVRNRDEEMRARGAFAWLTLTDSGACALLGADRLCTTHKRFGDKLLGDTCAMHPRSVGLAGERAELGGKLSCPEVARLALLHEDAFELDPFDPDTLPRRLATMRLPEGDDPYDTYFDDIRAAMLDVLARRELSLPVRMLLTVYFGDRTHAYFRRGTTTFDHGRLAVDIARLHDPALVTELDALRARAMASGAAAMGSALVHALRERMDAAPEKSRFRTLAYKVLAELLAEGAVAVTGTDVASVDPERLVAVHDRRRAAWEGDPALAARVELALTNLCRHYWMSDWYVTSPNLLAYTLRSVFRWALYRLLIFHHPLLGAADPGGDRAAVLERALIEVVASSSRATEKSLASNADGQADLTTLAQAVLLLSL